MSRTRAVALALVNWKGVFYERYLLDRHVTALEGANGAGKTTVMIAAYVALLPDMSRLRFTNLGESGATGGDRGIWGRLGEPGRPSYAVIDFALPDARRLIAGVHLLRKGEPSVEPTPFIVSGLGDDVRLQDLLFVIQGDREAVPELHELRENAARLGGHLQVCPSARDYFAALFDAGVMPLRLGTDEERNKFNEMLRTSMTGGISRALTAELRSFVLREEGSLADTLRRMKANLDACRRTRTEVRESRRLEREIGSVFEAGQMMCAAALQATRERADEQARRVAEAEADSLAASAEERLAAERLAELRDQVAFHEARGLAIEAALESARGRRDRLREALAAADALDLRQAELDEAAEAARVADAELESAILMRDQDRQARDRAREDYRLAARGLTDLQQGIEDLHRRAGAYRQAVRLKAKAEQGLELTELAVGDGDALLAAARAELARLDEERREASLRLTDAEAHRRRHAEALAALRGLLPDVPIGDEEAEATAIAALRRHRDQVELARRVESLAEALAEAEALAARQGDARARAATLGLAPLPEPGPAAEVVRARLDQAEADERAHREAERGARQALETAARELEALQARFCVLEASEPEWREHEARARRLGDALGGALGEPVVDPASLAAARDAVARALEDARRAEAAASAAMEDRLREARELLAAEGSFAPGLLLLRDRLDADLLAASFEAADPREAAVLEARLGSLVQALVVEDPRTALARLEERPANLPEVRLVARDANLDELISGLTGVVADAADLVVEEGVALRVSRIPERPRLGRRAREARAAELRAEAEVREQEREAWRTRRHALERLAVDGDTLLAGQALWLAGDPRPELAAVERARADTGRRIETGRDEIARHLAAAEALKPRIDGLRALLTEAFLLDPPDHGERAAQLAGDHRASQAARDRVARAQPFANVLEARGAALRESPLNDVGLARLRERVAELRSRRERLEGGIDALEALCKQPEALGWSDAPRNLAAQEGLVSALQARVEEAERAASAADDRAKRTEQRHDAALSVSQGAHGRRETAQAAWRQAAERFESIGMPRPTAEDERRSVEEVGRLEGERQTLGHRRNDLLVALGRQESRHEAARRRAGECADKLAADRREAEPARARWEQLRQYASDQGILDGAMAAAAELNAVHGALNLIQQAGTRRALLIERLQGAQGGAALIDELEAARDPPEARFAETLLDLWLGVRDWLRRRLPAQFAEADDPRESLRRLRGQLSSLEERLTRQEEDLRGASEDIARGIEVRMRAARGQVGRLSRSLEGVSFGGIRGIRVRMSLVERMDQVLRALRDGTAQGLLFQDELPIEEALDEIFRRYGGGRTGGQRLLDYREYVHLQVEIRRQADAAWEVANPTRLSTGEAIGVGAALMMVVLTEWERDATLLRGPKSHGSLRFLFLDEANRLSHDNLGVLFDLCQTLDLQLLIAAPEVARAEGNTTYRLVRHVTPDGREEVQVSGRCVRGNV